MKLTDLEKILSSSGYILSRSSKHRIWNKPGFTCIAVPNHRMVNKMIAKKILKEISRAQA